MLKALNHPNIVTVQEYFEDAERIYVVLEWLKGGELYQDINLRIKERRRFTERQAARILFQVASAVNYLHMNNIMHRDVKPENIIYCEGG
jgi:serine/threonine protein kinase